MTIKKLMIGATSSGSGKTTVTLGLLECFRRRGLTIYPFKVGPDYVDTKFHSRITKNQSRNLDAFLVQNKEIINYLFYHQASQGDIAVIEGVMGFFDGFGTDKDCCSSSSIAKQLDCPVLLVVDGKSSSTSIAAVVKGFIEFDTDVNIIGVVVNNIASENHYRLVKGAIEKYTTAKVYGYVKKDNRFSLPSRQLGLVPDNEIDNVMEIIGLIADSIETTVDVSKLLADLNEETINEIEPPFLVTKEYRGLKMAIAQDEAFHFYYPDNIELLEKYGVTITTFSPIKDHELPVADIYYFGGGYPEEFASELAENQSMRRAVLRASKANKCILAECGGLMYLGETLSVAENSYPMVGVFQGESEMTKGLKKFGYCYGILQRDSLIGKKGTQVFGHEFHHSIFDTAEVPIMKMEKKRDGEIVSKWLGGYQKNNTFASYLHLHFFQNEAFVQQLLDYVKRVSGSQ